MKRLISAAICLTWLASAAAAQTQPVAPAKAAAPVVDSTGTLKTDKDKVSYCIGLSMGRNMKKASVEVDAQVIARGLADGMAGKALLTDEQVTAVMTAFQQEMMAREAKKAEEVSAKNSKEGAAFLAENAKKPGVVTLPSGLQYKEIKAGAGPAPKPTDTVVAHYHGTLVNGTVFDSSVQRGKPETFPVKGVIPGWTEALQLMKVGSKWQLYIPAKLAYGEEGAGEEIGPNATLIFDVELLSIK